MELSDFAIGETLWTHVGAFRCTDIGTRVVVAVTVPKLTGSGPTTGVIIATYEPAGAIKKGSFAE